MTAAKVLIAEDEGLIAEELRERLEQMSMSVVGVVSSGEEAITCARTRVPDLILMDIHLRGRVDGIDAATQIRRERDIPVIYLTAHSDDATIARAKLTEPIGYLIKPLVEGELRVTIELGLHKHATERRLRESEERYATTLNSIGDAVIATDTSGRITFMNPVAESLTGWLIREAAGQPLDKVFQLVSSGDDTAQESPVTTAMRSDKVATLAQGTRLVTREGREIPIDDSTAPIRDTRKHLSGAVVVFRDVSAKLKAEEALRQSEEQLRQSQRIESIGRLAGGVAHDINNLMTVVIGCSTLLLDDLPPGHPLYKLVSDIHDAGERAARVAQQLLAFGRKQVLVPKVIAPNVLVHNIERLVRRLIGEDIDVVMTLDPAAGNVRVDPGQLEQVLIHLVLNARDAMPDGGRLSLATRSVTVDEPGQSDGREVPPGRYVVITVADTGTGMDVETSTQIFEPFFTTKAFGKGTGLGLATVYGIVKQSGGYIYVDSAPTRGSTFTIYFPELADASAAGHPPHPAGRVYGSETILLVEDDGAVRGLARTVLQQAGYTVLEAADGEEALRLYERHPEIDLLLTDAIMPRINGRALAERLAAMRPGLKRLFMSGYTDDRILRSGIERVGVPFIQKPFSPRDLTRAVRQVLDATS